MGDKILKKVENYMLPVSIIISVAMLSGAIMYTAKLKTERGPQITDKIVTEENTSLLEESVLSSDGVILPVTWGDIGAKLVSVGAIDKDKFVAIYEERGTFTDEYKKLLFGKNDERLKITNENVGYLLNLFWALGLANKNEILESGEMSNPSYGGAGNFASTGGWTMSRGDSMEHYSRHKFFNLTDDQQTLVEKVSRGIYRPCCGNSVHFPDCNHGMAMLGLLELMASQGASEEDLWKTSLVVNSYWFPDIYTTIATYMKDRGILWNDVDPQEILGIDFSSAQGFAKISAQVNVPARSQKGGGCDIVTGQINPAEQKQQSGCGV